MRRSPPRCASFRLAQSGFGAEPVRSNSTSCFDSYLHTLCCETAPETSLAHELASSNNLNPARAKPAYPISEEEVYELSNKLL